MPFSFPCVSSTLPGPGFRRFCRRRVPVCRCLLQPAAGAGVCCKMRQVLNPAKDVHLISPLAYWRVGEGTAAHGHGGRSVRKILRDTRQGGGGHGGGREELLPPRFGSTTSLPGTARSQDDALGRVPGTSPKAMADRSPGPPACPASPWPAGEDLPDIVADVFGRWSMGYPSLRTWATPQRALPPRQADALGDGQGLDITPQSAPPSRGRRIPGRPGCCPASGRSGCIRHS